MRAGRPRAVTARTGRNARADAESGRCRPARTGVFGANFAVCGIFLCANRRLVYISADHRNKAKFVAAVLRSGKLGPARLERRARCGAYLGWESPGEPQGGESGRGGIFSVLELPSRDLGWE